MEQAAAELQGMHEYRSGVSAAGWPMMDQNMGCV